MIVAFDKSPTTKDTIQFEIETISNNLLENPQTIDFIIIYHIEINPGNQNISYKSIHNLEQNKNFKEIKEQALLTPNEENIENLKIAKNKLNATVISNTFSFTEANTVMIIGNRDAPAWQEDGNDSIVTSTQPGVFQFKWDATNQNEGTYVLFWQWSKKGKIYNARKTFYINAAKQTLTSDKNFYTPENKYKMLMTLYTPNMYKRRITQDDYTPEIIEKLNNSIAEGFTIIEDFANQLGGMLDSNLAPKSVLPLLANMFNLKLRSNNTNRWREQIKRAVLLNKRKGTLYGLYEALNQAGIKLNKLTKLWQITSSYIQTDAFVIKKDSEISTIIGSLSKPHVSIDSVKIKSNNNEFIDVPINCIMTSPPVEITDSYTAIWAGLTLDEPVELFVNDVILIKYKIKKIPHEQQALEDYIQSLPLADNRPDTTPTKNWSVRLIEDDDPLFDLIIPNRYPFVPAVSYGKVRTKFLYSEQVYNMDTYNGSLRDSFSPCDLDNTFYDQCTACQSSQFNVDLEIEDLSEERIQEAKEIIKEYSPFHARLHYINIAGAVNEFVLPPQENIECLVQAGVPKQLTEVKQAEAIDYVIEWADGSKEKNKVKE